MVPKVRFTFMINVSLVSIKRKQIAHQKIKPIFINHKKHYYER